MESISRSANVSFALLQARLIDFIKLRIQNGDFTERGLARLLGISQSQIHNVLKKARTLKPELADHLMMRFDMDILDLLDAREVSERVVFRPAACGTCPQRAGEGTGAHVPLLKLGNPRRIGAVAERRSPSSAPSWKHAG